MAPLPKLPSEADEIDAMTQQVNRTGNRALAWHVFSLCRKAGLPVPDSIMALVDDFAAGISKVAQSALHTEPGDDTIRFEPADLGRLWRGDGGNDPVGALQAETRDEKVYAMLTTHVDRGMAVAAAIADVEKNKWKGLRKDRLWQIWGAMGKSPVTPQKPRRRTVR